MRLTLPPDLVDHYRPARSNDVRAESFGRLTAARVGSGGGWRSQRGSFDDQAIFGPRRRFVCACGKYNGAEYAGILCDRCGVVIATPDVRRSRCAHIHLENAMAHPLGRDDDRLTAVPVLPATFVEAPHGRELLAAYDRVLSMRDGDAAEAFVQLLALLAPVLVMEHRWDLSDRLRIAHGMALLDRDE